MYCLESVYRQYRQNQFNYRPISVVYRRCLVLNKSWSCYKDMCPSSCQDDPLSSQILFNNTLNTKQTNDKTNHPNSFEELGKWRRTCFHMVFISITTSLKMEHNKNILTLGDFKTWSVFRILFCEEWTGHRTFLLPPSFHLTIPQTDSNYGCRIINSPRKKLMWSLGLASHRHSSSSVFSTGATSSPGTQDRRNNGNKWKSFFNK